MYLGNLSQETMSESRQNKEYHETAKLPIELLISGKSCLLYTNNKKVEIFCLLHDQVSPLARRCTQHGRRNCYQKNFRKVCTGYIQKF